VTGMMGSFGMLGGAELSAPAQITGGIAEALIATAFGLGIAITCLVPLNYLHSKSEDARHEVEDAATHLELLMKPILESEARREVAQFSPRFPEGVMANAAMAFPQGNSLKDYA
jgi:flagellar motor component MotA